MSPVTRIAWLLPGLLFATSALAAEGEDTSKDTSSDEETSTTATKEILDRDDLEYQKETAPLRKIVDGLETDFSFDLEWHELDNIDFRRLDESGDQAIFDSDDRTGIAFLGLGMKLDYEVDDTVELSIGASHRGLWGTDQLGGTNAFGGWIYFTAAYVDWHPGGEDGVHVRLGRQPFEIGNLAGTRDYILADINDMIRVDVPVGKVGKVVLIPIDVVSSAPNADDVNFVGYISQSVTSPWNFRGRNRTLRHGAMFTLDKEDLPVQATAYGFFTSVGAGGSRRDGTPGTGADISYAGELGNFADNDWVANGGLRVQADLGPAAVYGQFEGSTGIDRKEQVARDVDTTGAAWGAGVVVRPEDGESGLAAQLSYFESLGAAYAEDGMMYSHGYVGMKGRQIGGTIANRYLGLHPTAYVGWAGVSNDLHDPDRKGGTRLIQGRVGYQGLGKVSVFANVLFMQDTGVTFLDMDELDTIDPPYGYSREEFAAEQRLGQVLGEEVDLDLWYQASDAMSLNLSGAVFLPGGYYKTEVARVAGTQLGSEDAPMAWGVYAGTHLRF